MRPVDTLPPRRPRFPKASERIPMLPCLAALAAGIGAAEAAGGGINGAWPLAAAALFLVLSVLTGIAPVRRAGLFQSIFLCISAASSGAALSVMSHRQTDRQWPDAPLCYRAVVTDDPVTTPSGWRVTLRLADTSHRGADVRCLLVREHRTTDTLRHSLPAVGDALRLRSEVRPPTRRPNPGEPDYEAVLRRQGISGTTYCRAGDWEACAEAESARIAGGMPATVRLQIACRRLRQRLLQRYTPHLDAHSLRILPALTLGDRRGLDRETRRPYTETGTAHILALSGLHLGIIFGLVQLLLSGMRRQRSRLVTATAGVAVLWAFTLLAGLPLSLVRAAAMLSLLQAASAMRRQYFPLNSLALAAAAILIAWPTALTDVGFQLSFASVLSIVWLTPRLPRWRRLERGRAGQMLAGGLRVTASAFLGTAPLVACHFHALPLYGLVANVVATPAVYALLGGGLAFLLLPDTLLPAVASTLQTLLHALETVLRGIASWPGATVSVSWGAAETAFVYTVAVLLIAVHRRHRGKVMIAAAAAAVLWTACQTCLRLTGHTSRRIEFYDSRTWSAVHCIGSDRRSWLWTDEPRHTDSCTTAIRANYWERKGLQPEIIGTAASGRTPGQHTALLTFGHTRIAIPAGRPAGHPPAEPLAVDILLVGRRWQADALQTQRFFRPHTVVLDGTLPRRHREAWRCAARRLGLQLHDMEREGAVTLRPDR